MGSSQLTPKRDIAAVKLSSSVLKKAQLPLDLHPRVIVVRPAPPRKEVSRGTFKPRVQELRMEITAYTHTGNLTATGVPPRVGLVAVDPRVIPLGTRMWIDGYGFAVAADTGGDIRGRRIDVFMNTWRQCMQWGRRKHVLVKIEL